MKYTKNELKGLIKECLIELLAEGLGGNLVEATGSRSTTLQPRRPVSSQRRQHDPVLDAPVRRPQSQSHALSEAIRTNSGGDPVLSSILADTARTTLQEQLAADRGDNMPVATDPASRMVAATTPEELFGDEATQKWADLAFMPSRPGARAS